MSNKLLFDCNEAHIALKNAHAEHNLLTFKGASNTDGHGILIGGRGSLVIGSGEGANFVYNGSVPNPGDEILRLASDGSINFYPGQQGGFTDKGTYINSNGEYVMNNSKVITEANLTFSLSGTTLTITKK